MASGSAQSWSQGSELTNVGGIGDRMVSVAPTIRLGIQIWPRRLFIPVVLTLLDLGGAIWLSSLTGFIAISCARVQRCPSAPSRGLRGGSEDEVLTSFSGARSPSSASGSSFASPDPSAGRLRARIEPGHSIGPVEDG